MMKTTLKLALPLAAMAAAGCETTPPPPAAQLSYSPASCTSSISVEEAISLKEEDMRRSLRNRTVTLTDELDIVSACLDTNGVQQPYTVFTIPRIMDRPVIYAGSTLDVLRTVMPDVMTLNEAGEVVRRFDEAELRRYGSQLGHSFSPRDEEVYVLIAANPDAVGGRRSTVETSSVGRSVTYSHGNGYFGSGVDTVGVQTDYQRVYSFGGDVSLRVVYPKPD